MVATMFFILAFPTLMSAMTGYDSNVVSRIEDGEDNLVPFDEYSRLLYVIHDGRRIQEHVIPHDGNYWVIDMASRSEHVPVSLNLRLSRISQ